MKGKFKINDNQLIPQFEVHQSVQALRTDLIWITVWLSVSAQTKVSPCREVPFRQMTSIFVYNNKNKWISHNKELKVLVDSKRMNVHLIKKITNNQVKIHCKRKGNWPVLQKVNFLTTTRHSGNENQIVKKNVFSFQLRI